MKFEQVNLLAPKIRQIAKKHGISKIFIFGSVARKVSSSTSDLDLLVEMEDGASLFGVAGFSYETEKLLGIHVDVIPTAILPQIKDQQFVANIQRDLVGL